MTSSPHELSPHLGMKAPHLGANPPSPAPDGPQNSTMPTVTQTPHPPPPFEHERFGIDDPDVTQPGPSFYLSQEHQLAYYESRVPQAVSPSQPSSAIAGSSRSREKSKALQNLDIQRSSGTSTSSEHAGSKALKSGGSKPPAVKRTNGCDRRKTGSGSDDPRGTRPSSKCLICTPCTQPFSPRV